MKTHLRDLWLSLGTVFTLLFVSIQFAYTQQTIFSRGEAVTANWWDGNNPWIRICDNWWIDRPDKNTCSNWDNIGRNDVFIGHNNNNPMNVNGAWFQLRDFTIQWTVGISRTFNASGSPSGLSFSRGLYNESSQTQYFNVPIGVDGTTVDFHAVNGDLSFSQDFFLNSNTARFPGSSTTTISGSMQGSNGKVSLTGSGTVILTNANNTYSGHTTVNSGTLRLNPSSNSTMNTEIRLNGGTLSTQGIDAGRTITNSGMLRLDANSTIDLSSNKHDLNLANSSSATWTSGAVLTILNWTGTPGLSGTGGRIFFGTGETGLSVGQLAQINIVGFDHGAMMLPSGELVAAPNPLPVEFLGMSASCNPGGSVLLNWQTASECNSSHFHIERSENGTSWSNIGVLEAAGNSIIRKSYNFVDINPIRFGVSYYRLVQYDFDGRHEIFGPISAVCNDDKNEFLVFPNPASDVVNISFQWNKSQTDLKLHTFDSSGKLLRSTIYSAQIGNNMIVQDLRNLPTGIYSITISDNNEIIESISLVRE